MAYSRTDDPIQLEPLYGAENKVETLPENVTEYPEFLKKIRGRVHQLKSLTINIYALLPWGCIKIYIFVLQISRENSKSEQEISANQVKVNVLCLNKIL